MKPWVIGNWKMNPATWQEALTLYHGFASLRSLVDRLNVVVCPATAWLSVLASEQVNGLALGSQNAHSEPKGAFTGETGIAMLQSLNVRFCIVGHSERRRLFHETDDMVAAKAAALIAAGITPVLCVGSEQQAEGPAEQERVTEQLRAVLQRIAPADQVKLIIAYEPVWAISTSGAGRVATPDYASAIIGYIRGLIAPSAREITPIIYGGSVDDTNARAFTGAPGINGVLVGAASIKSDVFTRLVQAVAV